VHILSRDAEEVPVTIKMGDGIGRYGKLRRLFDQAESLCFEAARSAFGNSRILAVLQPQRADTRGQGATREECAAWLISSV
jgi:hypothetical protein